MQDPPFLNLDPAGASQRLIEPGRTELKLCPYDTLCRVIYVGAECFGLPGRTELKLCPYDSRCRVIIRRGRPEGRPGPLARCSGL